MTQEVRLGLVGCGHIARRLYVSILSAVANQARLVAVCDLVPERAKATSGEFQDAYERAATEYARLASAASSPAERAQWQAVADASRAASQSPPRVYTSLDEFLRDDEIEAVIVTTQPVMHPVVSLAALETGRHVFSEGPMAANLRDADAMIALARSREVQLCIQYGTRFYREARQAKKAVEIGALGRLVLGRVDASWFHTMSSYFDRDDYRGTWVGEGGGSVFHHGRYGTDLFLHLVAEPVVEVAAFTGRFAHEIEFEDASTASLRFESGALGHVTTTTCAHPNPGIPRDRVELIGERASLQVFRQRGPEGWFFGLHIASEEPGYADEVRSALDRDVPPQTEDFQVVQMRAFLDSVRLLGPNPVPGESARAHVELTRATYKSALTGEIVTLPMSPDDPYYAEPNPALLAEAR